MILLDTHVWIWWTHGDVSLPADVSHEIDRHEGDGICVCAITCWEVAKLYEYGRVELPCDVADWMREALLYPGVRILDLTPTIAVESTRLPGSFHRDPADQLIVATARIHGLVLATLDQKIRTYPYVPTFP